MFWGDDFGDEVLGAIDRRRRGDSGDLMEDIFGSARAWIDEEIFSEGFRDPSGGCKRVRNQVQDSILWMVRIARLPIMPQRMVVCSDMATTLEKMRTLRTDSLRGRSDEDS